MPNWTPELERKLQSIRGKNPEASNPVIASLLLAETGVWFSGDAIRHKLKREAARPPEEPHTDVFEVPAVPQDSFVGFNSLFWDLETTGLTAIMGRLLACAFADSFGRVKTFRIEDYPGRTRIDDGRLAVAIRDELEKADHWITWNGKLYDVPFLNARLLRAGERPIRADIMHTDLMYYAKGQFVRIGSAKLVNVSKFIKSPNAKTDLDWDTWQLAGLGDKVSMDYVVQHAEADVLVTRDAFAALKPHVRSVHR